MDELRAARKELRRAARRSLVPFTTYTFPQYDPEGFHFLVGEYADRVVSGEIDRLMIFAPPQHGKSELISVHLPPLWLGQHPDWPVLLCSYDAELAYSKSRSARAIVASPRYSELFPKVKLARDSRAVHDWQIADRRGEMLATGIGGPLTGHGGMLGVIDDPLKNWEEAQSETVREAAWNWYITTFITRIWERGRIILIMTRWHEDDLAGRILESEPGRWTVLRLPALAETQEARDQIAKKTGQPLGRPDPLGREPGVALAPRRFTKPTLERNAKIMGSVKWSALGQGYPVLPEGNRFKRNHFPILETAPAEAMIVARCRYWDKASTEGGGKFSAGVRMALTIDGLVIVEHVARGQWSTGERRTVMKQTAEMDGKDVPVYIEQEPGSSGVDSVQDEVKMLLGWAVYPDKVTGSKDVRLEPLVAQAEGRNVRLLLGAWNQDYIDELCAVPNGLFRDQADSSAGAFNKLADTLPPQVVENPFYG